MDTVKAILLSSLRNSLRALLGTLLAIMPDVIAAFRAGEGTQDFLTNGMFVLAVAGLTGLVTLLQRVYEKLNAKPVA